MRDVSKYLDNSIIAIALPFMGFGIMLLLSFVWSPPSADKLTLLKGTVDDIYIKKIHRGGDQLAMILKSQEKIYRINQTIEYLDAGSNILKQIVVDDEVEVWVEKDNLWRDIYWVWQIKKNNQIVLSYSSAFNKSIKEKDDLISISSISIGIGITILSINVVVKQLRRAT